MTTKYSKNMITLMVMVYVLLVTIGGNTLSVASSSPLPKPLTPDYLNSIPVQPARLDVPKDTFSAAYLNLPIRFEENEGQANEKFSYVARGHGYTMFLQPDGIVMAMAPSDVQYKKWDEAIHSIKSPKDMEPPKKQKIDVLSIKFAGSTKIPELIAVDELPGRSNYFHGNVKKKWINGITAYRQVKYMGLYQGIDLVLYGSQKEIEYDFVVQPKADLSKITLKVEGAKSIKTNNDGDIILKTSTGEMLMHKPKIYQVVDGQRKTVNGNYVIKNHQLISFKVDDYDKKLPIVIDPVLQYSTYLGGSNGDQAFSIAVDSLGCAYVTGRTISLDFPIVNQFHTNYGGDYYDIFVSKFSADGASLVYSTYIGGSRDDEARGIAVDSNGSAYLTGSTYSVDFPIVNPMQTAIYGTVDAFVAKLSPNGASLLYSTYFGGTAIDEANAIAVDSGGNAYITGFSYSTDFPAINAFQNNMAGWKDAFVTKLSSSGTYIVYSTYYGGTSEEDGLGIAVDADSNVYITGFTSSTNFPTTLPLQATHGGGTYDAFIAKLSPSGMPLYSTYVGGSGSDRGNGIAIDASGNAFITGETASINYPVTSPTIQSTLRGKTDAFVTIVDATGSSWIYSTYLGGSDNDAGRAIAVDKNGNAYVTGETASTDFPTVNPSKSNHSGSKDAFMAKIIIPSVADNSYVYYSTYLGGSADDIGKSITVDQRGDAYLCGYTASDNYPTARSFQSARGGVIDAFVAKVRFKLYRSDFNADSMSDILWQNINTGQFFVWLMNGTKINSGDNTVTFNDANWQYKGKGDFDGDTRSDILWQNTATGQLTIWFVNNTSIKSVDSIKMGGSIFLADQNWQIKGIGDFDSDGNSDILWQNTSSGEVVIWFMSGSNIVNTVSLGIVATGWQIRAVDDFNGDGRSDILWQNSSTGQVIIWLVSGINITAIGSPGVVSNPAWQVIATGDFNGDGMSDVLWQNTTTGQLYVWLLNGVNITSGASPATVTYPTWQVKAVNDFNNDGMADVLWYNTSTGQVYIWLMNGTSISSGGSPGAVGINSGWQIK
ncbi:MAG: SBBP repeat-containing protein [Nitrospirae bacterium]|nr:SBBP repeat-containing protein [Nitrospirota bacterium]